MDFCLFCVCLWFECLYFSSLLPMVPTLTPPLLYVFHTVLLFSGVGLMLYFLQVAGNAAHAMALDAAGM